MHPTPKVRADRAVAMLAALAVNGWAAWALADAMRPGLRPVPEAVVLQAIWLPRHTRAPMEAAATPPRSSPGRTAQRLPRNPGPSDTFTPDATSDSRPPPDPMASRPMSALYLAQLRQAAGEELDAAIATHDPLADRAVHLPGKAANRFRMREPMSAARAIAMVGQLFGGNDPAEPCRRNRTEIAALGTQGDSRRLQQELDFERRWCRP